MVNFTGYRLIRRTLKMSPKYSRAEKKKPMGQKELSIFLRRKKVGDTIDFISFTPPLRSLFAGSDKKH